MDRLVELTALTKALNLEKEIQKLKTKNSKIRKKILEANKEITKYAKKYKVKK